ncbi:MAG: hypothetical protein FJY17_00505 [Bacteroidetes bacterium]|nr:hypothetical protein [Bacteroidota bacterium]
MAKILKYVGSFFGLTMEWLLVFIVVAAFAIRTSPFQTFLAQQLASYLSSELNTTIAITKVDIVFFDRVSIEGLTIMDQYNDTLVSTPKLMATIDEFDIEENVFKLNEVELDGGSIKVQKSKKGIMNYQFLVDYFSPEDPSTSPPLRLSVSTINLENVTLEYNDQSAPLLTFGVDFNHLKLNNLSVVLSSFNLNNDVFSCQLDKLTFGEKSGFRLSDFTSFVSVGPKGISFKKLFVSLPDSKLSAPHFRLIYKDWSSFDHFEDSVFFDASIDASELSLKDISFWVPTLEGMTDKLKIKGSISANLSKLKLNNLEVRLFNQTYLRGDFMLPDFRKKDLSSFNAQISSSYLDFDELAKITLPKRSATFDMSFFQKKMRYLELKGIDCVGSIEQVILKANEINSKNGRINIRNPVKISSSGQTFKIASQKAEEGVILDLQGVNLAELLDEKNLGIFEGKLKFSALNFSDDGSFLVEDFSGDISKAVVNGYNYRNIKIISPAIDQKEFQGKVEISDPNLKLSLNGKARYTGKQQYDLKLDITHAHLSKLGLVSQDSLSIAANLRIDVSGNNFENLNGSLSSSSSIITRGQKSLEIPTFGLKINRYRGNDEFELSSEVMKASIKGKIDYGSVLSQFSEDVSSIFPAIRKTNELTKRGKESNFEFDIHIGALQPIIALFLTKLTISEGTKLSGSYNSKKYQKSLHLFSDSLAYDNIFIKSISVDQVITNAVVEGIAKIEKFQYDSIEFDNLHYDNFGKNGFLESRLTWDLKGKNNSELAWSTVVKGKNDIYLSLKPSFFSLENYRWEIPNESQIKIISNNLSLDSLSLLRDNQKIKIFGGISYNDIDTLKVVSENISLNELSQLFKSEKKFEGFLSGQTKISTSGKNFILESDLTIDNLFLDGEEVGKVTLTEKWTSLSDKIDLSGILFYKGSKTMNFVGNYNLANDKLDLSLDFDKTDLRFLNAFLDPELVSDINGKLHGKLYVTGNSDEPHLSGKLNLSNVNALSGLTGVRYSLNGAIKVEKNAVQINHIPVTDDEGNEARLTATINHINFDKINYDIYLDFDDALKGKNNFNRFLVLNTQYKDGEYYFGKAYGKGNMSISGSDKIVDVLVNVESMKGTNINFPMYGAEEFEENEDFISFKSKGVQKQFVENLRNYSGVNLEMNFIVNTNAEMKLIFDNLTGDQIEAKGFGELNMKLDPFYNFNVSGKYEITEGSKYNFAMGSFKQPFDIVPGSTLKWNGDILDAELNIGTSVTMRRVSLLELSPDIADKNLASQDVMCLLNLKDKLMQPTISFDIEVPKASETGKALIAKVKEDKDELNKQFFSLLLVKKFQPLKGSITAGGSAAIDILETQMNEILGKLSSKYKLNVDYGKDETLNETSIGFGMKTQFFQDRLIVSGTFGVGGLSGESGVNTPTSNLIGDVNLEYLINEKGTFRVSAFNESSNNAINANTVNNTEGLHTQGIGLSYHEDFNTWKNFMLLQYCLDLFRKDKKYWKSRDRKEKKKVPVNPQKNKGINSTEEETDLG